MLVPLHNPVQLAKQAATLQELSGGRFRLGVGMGWHEDEFRFMGVPFHGRGRRGRRGDPADPRALARRARVPRRVLVVLGRDFGPLPEPEPEIWVGGGCERALRRALELGDVWHPTRSTDPDEVRKVKAEHPELRVVPRTTPDKVDAFLDAGAEGAVVSFRDDAELVAFARRYDRA